MILQHMFSNAFKVTRFTLKTRHQLLPINIHPMLGCCVFDEIQFLWSFKITRRTTVEGIIKVLFQVKVETSFSLEDFLTFRTLFLLILFWHVLTRQVLDVDIFDWGFKTTIFTPEHLTNPVILVQMHHELLSTNTAFIAHLSTNQISVLNYANQSEISIELIQPIRYWYCLV